MNYSEREKTIIAGCKDWREAIAELRSAGYVRSAKSVEYKWRAMRKIQQPRNAPKPMSLGMNVLFRLGI